MESVPSFNVEDGPEDDSSDTKKSKRKELGRGILANAEKFEKQTASPDKERARIAKESLPILDTLLGSTRLASEVSPSEADKGEATKPSEEAREEAPLSGAEQRVADALVEEGEIDLRGIPSDRDDSIVEQAVKRVVAESIPDTSPEVVEPSSEPELVEVDPTVLPEETVESPHAPTDSLELSTAEQPPDASEEDELTPTSVTTRSTPAVHSSPLVPSGRSATHGSSTPSGLGAAPHVSGLSPLTPPSPGASSSVPTPSYHRYTAPVRSYTAPPAPGYTVPPAAELAREVGAVEDNAFKRGRNKGLVVGLIAGGGIEHIRHKRREKKMERKFVAERREQTKKMENMRWGHLRETETKKVRDAAAETYRNTEHVSAARVERRQAAAPALATVEAVKRPVEKQTGPEKKTDDERKNAERILRQAEQAAKEYEKQQLEIAQGHRVERSAWHNIEVDEHGKVAQETSIQYGDEYYHERAAETKPGTKAQVDGAAGEIALIATALKEKEKKKVKKEPGFGATEPLRQRMQRAPLEQTPQSVSSSKLSVSLQPIKVVKAIASPPTTPSGVIGWAIALVLIIAAMIVVSLL